jgi:outer membrane immunogenic protein
VGGLEIDFSGADLKEAQSFSAPSGEAISLRAKIDTLATARARLGFLAVRNLLVYGTGGFAWGHASAKETICTDVVCSTVAANESMFGWTAGAGLECKLVENLLLRVEYLHYDFVKQDFTWANQSLAVTPLVLNAATPHRRGARRHQLQVLTIAGGGRDKLGHEQESVSITISTGIR